MNVNEVFEQMELEQLAITEPEEGEKYCTLESDVIRQIIVPDKYINIGVESDEKANRIKFKFPRFVNDVDLSLLNLRVNYRNGNGEVDQNVTENKSVTSDGYVTFDWRPTRKVTKYKGEIYFIVCALKANSDGTVTNEWNTTLAKSECLEGLEPEQITEEEKEQISDYMLELLSIIDTTKQSFLDDTKAQTEAVKAEIKSYGDSVKESIPQDYTALDTLVRDIDRTRSNGISETSTGETIEIINSEGKLFRNIKLFGKGEQIKSNGYQLFDASRLDTWTEAGITATNNEDGSFTISGGESYQRAFNKGYEYTVEETMKLLKKPGTLKLDCGATTYPKFEVILQRDSPSDTYKTIDNKISPTASMEITEEEIGYGDLKLSFAITNSDATEAPFKAGTIKPMLYMEGDGTWEPFTNGEGKPSPNLESPIVGVGNYNESTQKYDVEIESRGSQLFDASKIPTKSSGGAKVTNNKDGSFTVEGSGNMTSDFYVSSDFISMRIFPGDIHLKTDFVVNPHAEVAFCDAEHKEVFSLSNPNTTSTKFMVTEDIAKKVKSVKYKFYTESENQIKPGTVRPMIYQIGNGTWKPYNIIKSILSLDMPLYGIPVDYGGNYTDKKGQQWISDVVDLEAKILTRYCGIETFDGSEDESWILWSLNGENCERFYTILSKLVNKKVNGVKSQSLCNRLVFIQSNDDTPHYRFSKDSAEPSINQFVIYINKEFANSVDGIKSWLKSNSITVLYPLETPITTPLTPDQISALQKLQSYCPNTNMFTNTNPQAVLEVEYNVDIKMYVNDLVKQSVTELLNIN